MGVKDTKKLWRDPGTGQYVSAGRTPLSKQSGVHGLFTKPITADGMQPIGSIDLDAVKKELDRQEGLKDKLKVLDPETAIKALSNYGSYWFGHEFGPDRQFLQVRYHIGTTSDVWEFYSKAYPYDLDTWSVMENKLVEHMRTEFTELEPEDIKGSLLRILFFHNPAVYNSMPQDPGDKRTNVCRAPIDFAFSLLLTVDEFVDYYMFRKPLKEFRFSFDANYFWMGDKKTTTESFRYIEHWDFYSNMLQSFGELLGRPLSKDSVPISLLEAHCSEELPETLVSLATIPKNTWSDSSRQSNRHAAIYSPRIDAVFNEFSTTITFFDETGLLRMYCSDLKQGDFTRRVDANLIDFEKKY